jgi:hypothetical protein
LHQPGKRQGTARYGERFGYSNALRMGLINRVFQPEKLEPGVRALAQTIAENAPLTIHAAKRTIDAFAPDLPAHTMQELMDLVANCSPARTMPEDRRASARSASRTSKVAERRRARRIIWETCHQTWHFHAARLNRVGISRSPAYCRAEAIEQELTGRNGEE